MKFKNIFKNTQKMTTENTEREQELDSATLEANANGEQLIVEELSIEEQLTKDLAGEKDKCFQVGMNEYLSKPIIYSDLEDVFLKWCSV